MTPNSPSTDSPAVRAAAKAKRRAAVAADPAARRRVARWCTSAVPMRGPAIVTERDDMTEAEDE